MKLEFVLYGILAIAIVLIIALLVFLWISAPSGSMTIT